MKRIYLASPYGFSCQQRTLLLPKFVETLTELGLMVHEPFAKNQQIKFAAEKGWAYEIGQRDLREVCRCDAIFAIVNGAPPDEGVMVELGAAIALGKKTFLFRDDFRRSADCEDYPLNLMLFTGLPRVGWRDYYYTSLEEIPSPEKALVRWLRGGSD
jgi:nucleoside 2-deoxyribosyltransferase